MPFSRNAQSIAVIHTFTLWRPASPCWESSCPLSPCLSFHKRKMDRTTKPKTRAFKTPICS